MLGDLVVLVGFVPPHVKAQASDQYREGKLPSHSLDGRQTSRYIRARHNVAITDRCQSNETKIHRAGAGEIAAGPDLLESPIEVAKKDPRKQIGAEDSVDVLAFDRLSAKSEAQRASRCEERKNCPPVGAGLHKSSDFAPSLEGARQNCKVQAAAETLNMPGGTAVVGSDFVKCMRTAGWTLLDHGAG